MLVECGLVRATLASDGTEFVFRPSLGRIASLGAPHEIVETFAALHGARAEEAAADVLACLCDQDDLAPLIGEPVATPDGVRWQGGEMPPAERVIIARHLMQHGIVGRARPDAEGSGEFCETFEAAKYIAAARAHLGMSAADAEALSMTELQMLFEAKFPEAAKDGAPGIPSDEEFAAAMAHFDELERRRAS